MYLCYSCLRTQIVLAGRRVVMSIVAETPQVVFPAGTWSVDPVHSTVEFHVTHAGIATVKGRALVLEGDLTIRGVTKPVELRGSFRGATVDAYGNERIGIDLMGSVDRQEFGVSWNAPLPGGGFLLPDEIP